MKITRFEKFWQVLSPLFEKKKSRGRPAKHAVKDILKAIVWILDTGSQWRNLPKEFPPKSTVHYWHQRWSEDGMYELMATFLAQEAYDTDLINLAQSFIDGTFIRTKGSTDRVGKTKCGKGSKLMVLVAKDGFPLSIHLESAQIHESKLVEDTLDVSFLEDNPAHITGDKAYDSDPLDERLKRRGIMMNAPHRQNRKKPKTQSQEGLLHYPERWRVEDFNAKFQWARKALIRYEKKSINYLGFALLSTIGVMGQFLGIF